MKTNPPAPAPDCSHHARDVAGITDMHALATMIGDLHYETLTELLKQLSNKLSDDCIADYKGGRPRMARALNNAAAEMGRARMWIHDAWENSKPFMNT